MNPVISRTLIAYVEDRPGVLARVVSLLRRRNYSIDSLNVGPTDRAEISQVTLMVRLDEDGSRRLVANLFKLVEVVDVEEITDSPAVVRELALIKVSSEAGPAVRTLCEAASARILEQSPYSYTIEVTGTCAQIDAAVEALRPRGILRLVRTGAVAVSELAEEHEASRPAARATSSTPMKAAGGAR